MYISLASGRYSFHLEQEKVTHTRFGPKRSKASLGDGGEMDCIVIASTMPTAGGEVEQVEVRQVLDEGLVHVQVKVPSRKPLLLSLFFCSRLRYAIVPLLCIPQLYFHIVVRNSSSDPLHDLLSHYARMHNACENGYWTYHSWYVGPMIQWTYGPKAN